MTTTTITTQALLMGWGSSPLGVLTDHLDRWAAAGGRIQEATRPWAVDADGTAHPILCGEVVEAFGEDGPYTTRCGARVLDLDPAACPGHAAQITEWRAMSEAELAAWERDREVAW